MSEQKFERIKVVGRGQFGTAYLVKDAANRKLVLKEISIGGMGDTEKKATFAEVDLLRSLNHINIVKYLGHFFKKYDFVILMEFCDGPCPSQRYAVSYLQHTHIHSSTHTHIVFKSMCS